MDRCSYFIEKKSLFGSYPTQEMVHTLEGMGIEYFVDLTTDNEANLTPYKTTKHVIKYPIQDHQIPRDIKSFTLFIIKLSKLIKHNIPIYIHCKGGHGRSGVVVACILGYLYDISATSALKQTTLFHNERKEMSSKSRLCGCPSDNNQRYFVINFFKPIYFYRPYISGPTAGFSAFSIHSVNIEGFGLFPTAEAAYQAYKDPRDEKYVKKQETAFCPLYSKKIGHECNLRKDWSEKKNEIMMMITEKKFTQHSDIREVLLNTGIKKIIERCPDTYWGNGIGDIGKNVMGKILMSVRHKLLHDEG
jgi:ribA/ribD-fused uncharacterized protein